MSADIDNLVETSNNLARVIVKEGKIFIACLTRSSIESSKMDLAQALEANFKMANLQVSFSGSYPGWTPNVSSPILKVLTFLKKLKGCKLARMTGSGSACFAIFENNSQLTEAIITLKKHYKSYWIRKAKII